MSILNGLHFCDNPKCGKSIPKGEFRLKGLCEHCWNKKRSRWQVLVVGCILFIAASSFGSILGLMERSDIERNEIVRVEAESVERDTQIAQAIQIRLEEIYDWADKVGGAISSLGSVASAQRQELSSLRAELDDLKAGLTQNNTSQDSATCQIAAINNRITAIEKDVVALQAIPTERLETVLKSVVGVGFHATQFDPMGSSVEEDFMNGSGGIFKKEAVGNVEGVYRYYVLTAYHCYQGYLDYQENLKPTLPLDKQKDAYPLVFLYNGNVRSVARATIVYPQHFTAVFPPISDWIILSFESKLNLPVIELADDAQIRVGDVCYATGVFPAEAPSIFAGWVAVVKTGYQGTTGYQGHAFPGQSGGAILNKDLKLVGMTLAMSISRVGADVVLSYGWNIKDLRARHKAGLPEAIKKLLEVK
jgi:S1-C subfamily serine protease